MRQRERKNGSEGDAETEDQEAMWAVFTHMIDEVRTNIAIHAHASV
jgi:hypothetical protein